MTKSTVEFWQGDFAKDYNARNKPVWRERVPLLTHILEETGASTFLDIGTNAGFNLEALRSINPEYIMSGIDVNNDALALAQVAGFDVQQGRADQAVELFGESAAELVITSGVLIHIAPDDLVKAMTAIRDVSSQYVLAIEYESDTEQEIEYRGNKGVLWKRPFGKLYEALGMSLIETGKAQGYNDCTYWLMEKT